MGAGSCLAVSVLRRVEKELRNQIRVTVSALGFFSQRAPQQDLRRPAAAQSVSAGPCSTRRAEDDLTSWTGRPGGI